jgi:hypothetical protein
MDYLEYKGYKGSVEYSKEDNCLFGKVQGMSKDLIVYEGQTLDELRKDFEDGVDSYLEGCRADGIEACDRAQVPVKRSFLFAFGACLCLCRPNLRSFLATKALAD